MDSETDECMEILDLLDTYLANYAKNISKVPVKKYSYAFYSKAATFVGVTYGKLVVRKRTLTSSFSFSRTSEQRTSGQIIFELRQGSDGHFTDVPPAIPLDKAETSLQEFLDSAPTYEIEDELFYYPPYGAPRWQVLVSDERPRSPSPDPYFTPVLAVHSSTFCTSDEECARGRHILHHCPSN
ncbi:hypothetical protein BT96DRAFT_1007246 [Gymnopus androsaceus JB14]|uniref:Uncharacterized protein n=1 Tax=Gymnopus androsaceus JB14 TaxID=1447944 RepID=A0A6A4GIM4_9AGAR|nr:hypothetical protein BT96DRAFT_1007246 [Gymnopus androsaceus JB14]